MGEMIFSLWKWTLLFRAINGLIKVCTPKKGQNSCVHRIDTNGRAVHWAQAECVFHKSQVKVCYEKCAIKGESKKT